MRAWPAGAPWLGLEQAAGTLGVSVRTVQNMAARGELRRRQVGRRSQYQAFNQAPSAAHKRAASVAPVASVEDLLDRIENVELAVEDRTAELEERLEELAAELETERLEREELAEALAQANHEAADLRERLDDLEDLLE